MSKTNHPRGFTTEKFPSTSKDYCNGKRGERRDIAGAKKYIHSRHRASTKANLAELAKAEADTDYNEVIRRPNFEDNYRKRSTHHPELLLWIKERHRRFDLTLKGQGYHHVPNKRSQISNSITNCPGCEICLQE